MANGVGAGMALAPEAPADLSGLVTQQDGLYIVTQSGERIVPQE